jgi:hypothetical protein
MLESFFFAEKRLECWFFNKMTGIDRSLESHRIAFASEESRLTGKAVIIKG